MITWRGILVIFLASCTGLMFASPIDNPDLDFVKSVTQNENTKTAIDRLSSVSRIITAVSILRGLSDASVPADAVISELLNLGSINLASLENFDKTKVDEFINKLKSTNMAGNGIFEKGIIDMKTIKETWIKWTKAPELPDKAAYGELVKLKSLDVEGLKSKITTVETSNKKLKQFSSLTDQDVASLKSSLKSVTDALNTVKGKTDLKKTVDLLKRWKKFSSMVHVFQLFNYLPVLKYLTDDEEQEFISNMNALKNLESLKPGPILDAISSIVSSRFIFHPTDRQHTTGFVNGFEDIQKLENDVKDEWVTDLFAAFPNISKVTTLINMKEPMVKLDSKWKSAVTRRIYTSMKQVDNLRSLLVTLPKIPSENEIKSGLSTLAKCHVNRVDFPHTKDLLSSVKSLGSLSSKMITFKDIEILSQQNNVADIIDQLSKNTNPDDIQKLHEFFKNLEPMLKIMTHGTNIKEEIENIETYSAFVTDYQNNKFILWYKPNFECFAHIDFENLFALTRITTQIRNIKSSNALDDVKTVAAVVSGTSENLKEVRQSVTSVVQAVESKSLEDMSGFKKYSKPFGEAVNALVSMMEALEKEKDFETMLLKGSLVEGAVRSLNINQIEDNFRKDWGSLTDTVYQISELFGGIREWRYNLNITKDAKFDSLVPLFSNLAALSDVNLQTEKRLAAVESDNVKYVFNITVLRRDFIKEIMAVSKLDLQFSRFKSAIADMPATMKEVSKILMGGDDNFVYAPSPKRVRPDDTYK